MADRHHHEAPAPAAALEVRLEHPLAAGAGSARGVLLSPAAGAVLMSASTVVVALHAMLLRRLRPSAYDPTSSEATMPASR
jgi:cation transport ATPase